MQPVQRGVLRRRCEAGGRGHGGASASAAARPSASAGAACAIQLLFTRSAERGTHPLARPAKWRGGSGAAAAARGAAWLAKARRAARSAAPRMPPPTRAESPVQPPADIHARGARGRSCVLPVQKIAPLRRPSRALSRRLPPLDAGLRSGWSPPCVPCLAQRWAVARLALRRSSHPPLHSPLRRARAPPPPPLAPPPSCAAAAWRRARAERSCWARCRAAAAVALPRPRCARALPGAPPAGPGRDVLQSPREAGHCTSGGCFFGCPDARLTRVRACVAPRLWPCLRRRLGRCRCRPTCTALRSCARSTSPSTTPRPCCTGTRKPALRHDPTAARDLASFAPRSDASSCFAAHVAEH